MQWISVFQEYFPQISGGSNYFRPCPSSLLKIISGKKSSYSILKLKENMNNKHFKVTFFSFWMVFNRKLFYSHKDTHAGYPFFKTYPPDIRRMKLFSVLPQLSSKNNQWEKVVLLDFEAERKYESINALLFYAEIHYFKKICYFTQLFWRLTTEHI